MRKTDEILEELDHVLQQLARFKDNLRGMEFDKIIQGKGLSAQ